MLSFDGLNGFIVLGAFYLFVVIMAPRRPITLFLPFISSSLFKGWAVEHIALFRTLDYTLFVTGLAWLGAIIAVFSKRARKGKTSSLPVSYVLLFALFTVLVLASTRMEYDWSRRVIAQHVVFNVTGFLLPLLLLRDSSDVRYFLKVIIGFGVFVAAVSMLSEPSRLYRSRTAFLSYGDPITLAQFCSYPVIILVGAWRSWPRFSPRTRLWIVPVAVVLVAGLLQTGSRGPLLHLLIALSVASLLNIGRDVRTLAIVAVLVLAFVLSAALAPEAPGVQRMATVQDPTGSGSIMYRFNAWNYVLDHWDTKFFFGHGVGTIEHKFGVQAHSLMLEVLFANGVVGLLLAISIVFTAIGGALVRGGLGFKEGDSYLLHTLLLISFYLAVVSTTGLKYAGLRVFLAWFSMLVMCGRIVERERKPTSRDAVATVGVDPTLTVRSPWTVSAREKSGPS